MSNWETDETKAADELIADTLQASGMSVRDAVLVCCSLKNDQISGVLGALSAEFKIDIAKIVNGARDKK